jgi:3-hydroxyisobutyrate dehydrogenase-like beta-hydroxyacid dehydrogenase
MDVLCDSVVGSPLLHYKRDVLAARDFEPAFSVSQMIKDLELIGEVADRAGQRLDLVGEVRRRFEQARRAGLADHDYFVLVRDALGGDQAEASEARSRMRSTSS